MQLYLNRAHCYIKIHAPKKACLDIHKVLYINPKNAKAFYRMSKAKRMFGSLSEAKGYLLKAQRLRPDDADIGAELESLDMQMNRVRILSNIIPLYIF